MRALVWVALVGCGGRVRAYDGEVYDECTLVDIGIGAMDCRLVALCTTEGELPVYVTQSGDTFECFGLDDACLDLVCQVCGMDPYTEAALCG